MSSDPDNDTTEVTWAVPVAVDNSGFIPVLTSDPAVVPPAHFPIGITIVTYRAEDLSQNVAKCKFYILVLGQWQSGMFMVLWLWDVRHSSGLPAYLPTCVCV